MVVMRRAFAAWPTSTTCFVCVSGIPLLHGRGRRRNEGERAHLDEQRRGLAEESLPLRVLHRLAAYRRPLVEVLVRPEVHDLVELRDLRLEEADVLRILLAHRHDPLEMAEPLPRLANLGAVRPHLVNVTAGGRRLQR